MLLLGDLIFSESLAALSLGLISVNLGRPLGDTKEEVFMAFEYYICGQNASAGLSSDKCRKGYFWIEFRIPVLRYLVLRTVTVGS